MILHRQRRPAGASYAIREGEGVSGRGLSGTSIVNYQALRLLYSISIRTLKTYARPLKEK